MLMEHGPSIFFIFPWISSPVVWSVNKISFNEGSEPRDTPVELEREENGRYSLSRGGTSLSSRYSKGTLEGIDLI